MQGVDKSTELWRHSSIPSFKLRKKCLGKARNSKASIGLTYAEFLSIRIGFSKFSTNQNTLKLVLLTLKFLERSGSWIRKKRSSVIPNIYAL